MVDWQNVTAWDPSILDTVVDNLVTERKKCYTASESIQDIDKDITWTGEGATAAASALGKLEDKTAELLADFGKLIGVTEQAVEGVKEVRTTVLEAISLANEYNFTIASDGSKVEAAENDPTVQGKLSECSGLISKALRKAEETDAAYAAALAEVTQDQVPVTESLGDVTPGLPDGPPDGATPEQVSDWWSRLAKDERQRYVDRFTKPEALNDESIREQARKFGNLDGIEGWARDKVNRSLLEWDIEDTKRQKDAVPGNNGPGEEYTAEGQARNHERARLRERLEELEKLRGQLGAEEGKPPKQLLLYDPATGEKGHENLHAAVSYGDVDKAKHVSTIVPGMTTTVDSLVEPAVRDMGNLHRVASEKAGGDPVAVVTWMGYDAPASPPGDWGVFEPEKAQMGGDRLVGFVEGIDASHKSEGNNLHQSVLGHSYGSTTSSHAMTKVKPGVVDDFAMYGSPGAQGSGETYNVPEGHTYAMRYRTDFVEAGRKDLVFNKLGEDPMTDRNIKTLDSGLSPSEEKYERAPIGFEDPLVGYHAHTEYMNDGTQSQDQLANVVVGKAG